MKQFIAKIITINIEQVKCEVNVKRLHRLRATRDIERCLSGFTAYHFARASAGEDPTPENYFSIMDLSRLGQISKSKIKP